MSNELNNNTLTEALDSAERLLLCYADLIETHNIADYCEEEDNQERNELWDIIHETFAKLREGIQ